jgi:hypothetical protein
VTRARRIVYALCAWAHVNLQEYCREFAIPYQGVRDTPELVGIILSRAGKPTEEMLTKFERLIASRDEQGNELPKAGWFERQAAEVQASIEKWPAWKKREAGIEHLFPAPTHPCA